LRRFLDLQVRCSAETFSLQNARVSRNLFADLVRGELEQAERNGKNATVSNPAANPPVASFRYPIR
jgi:hypothetical protein